MSQPGWHEDFEDEANPVELNEPHDDLPDDDDFEDDLPDEDEFLDDYDYPWYDDPPW